MGKQGRHVWIYVGKARCLGDHWQNHALLSELCSEAWINVVPDGHELNRGGYLTRHENGEEYTYVPLWYSEERKEGSYMSIYQLVRRVFAVNTAFSYIPDYSRTAAVNSVKLFMDLYQIVSTSVRIRHSVYHSSHAPWSTFIIASPEHWSWVRIPFGWSLLCCVYTYLCRWNHNDVSIPRHKGTCQLFIKNGYFVLPYQ